MNDPEPRPSDDAADPDSALPSVSARVLAFVAILLGGAGGAIIGYSFSHLQCHRGTCVLRDGLVMVGGTLAGALGVAVVAMLTLRALGEWRSVRAHTPTSYTPSADKN